MKLINFFFSILFLGAFIANMIPQIVEAQPQTPSIGMSSSFSTYNSITIPQGGRLFADGLFIVIYNYGDDNVTAVVNVTAPDGIKVILHSGEGAPGVPPLTFVMMPKSYIRARVEVDVDDTVVPGLYTIYVQVFEQRSVEPGKVVLLPSTAHKLNIVVSGSYGIINVSALDPSGRIASNSLLRLYALVNGTEVNILDSSGGRLYAKVVPGDYIVRAYLGGELVGEKKFTLRNKESRNLNIHIRIAYFERFTVMPVYKKNGEIALARIHIIVKNLYKTLDNVSMILLVYKNDVLIEHRTLMSSSVLPLGRSEYYFDYIPPNGWKPGNYTFQAILIGYNGKNIAISGTGWIYVEASHRSFVPYVVLLVIAVIVALLLTRLKRGRVKKDRQFRFSRLSRT